MEWTTEKRKVKDLIQLDFNPRKITEEKKKKLSTSLKKFNLAEIPCINTDKVIYGIQRRFLKEDGAGWNAWLHIEKDNQKNLIPLQTWQKREHILIKIN